MPHYIALIDGEAAAYGVAFPDCPGCTAMGATIDEAISLGTVALREWMADRVAAGVAPPPARSVAEIRADAEEAEALASGAIMAAVPLLLDEGRSVRANLSLDAGLLAAIDEAAAARGVTRSTFVASASRDKIVGESDPEFWDRMKRTRNLPTNEDARRAREFDNMNSMDWNHDGLRKRKKT